MSRKICSGPRLEPWPGGSAANEFQFLRNLWVSASFCEFLWLSVSFYEFLWLSMSFWNFYEFLVLWSFGLCLSSFLFYFVLIEPSWGSSDDRQLLQAHCHVGSWKSLCRWSLAAALASIWDKTHVVHRSCSATGTGALPLSAAGFVPLLARGGWRGARAVRGWFGYQGCQGKLPP